MPVHPPAAVVLRPVEPADLEVFYVLQLDPEANRIAVANARDPAAFTTHWERAMVDPAVTTRAILADGVLVGNVASFVMEGLPSVGYWIAREHWSRGIATRALALLLAEVPTRPLYARAARSNVGSVRVLERCGFVITGYEQSVGTERFPAGSGGLGTASTQPAARVERVVGDQVEHVQPGEREPLGDARGDARLLRRGTKLVGEFRFA